MNHRSWGPWAITAICLILSPPRVSADDLPTIPVGLDAYRMWQRWPYQRIGARAYMRSTYDRAGGNESADASHFLYQESKTFNVTLDVQGPGVLYFARYNHWHGSPWHYEIDGTDHVAQETSTADPLKPAANSVFIPQELFPNPLTWTWSITKGADLMWVPLPFERSFRMAYTRTRYGTGYYIYHQYVPGVPLSEPIRAWDGKTPPDPAVLELLGSAGTDIAPKVDSAEGRKLGLIRQEGKVDVPKDGAVTVAHITAGPSMMRALELSVPSDQAVAFSRAMLRITWDGRGHPSVDAPVSLFYGAGTLYNRDGREYLVKALPAMVKYENGRVRMACYFPMPFFREAKIELVGNGEAAFSGIEWSVRHHPFDAPPNHVGYFHATYRDHADPELGKDLVLLDTRGAEGAEDWSGSFIGTSFIFTHRNNLGTLEGDPRFFFDDSQSPQAYGTGTEEWGGGGDYWGGLNMTLPLAGHPVGARNLQEARSAEDQIHSAYRFLLADLMPFGKNAVIRLEHGGQNESKEHYKTVTYWYGIPAPSLVKTDELKVGDAQSEKAHNYVSPNASEPYKMTSRYEWGVDTLRTSFEQPQKDPGHYAEFEFEALANRKYHIWVRGKNLDNSNMSDAFWIQFDDLIGTSRLDSTYGHTKGFGNWLDRFPANTYAWSSALPQEPPQTVTFVQGGKHRIRVQPRHAKHFLERIWLSTTRNQLPERDANPASAADSSEIVLNAADAARLQGEVKVVADSNSPVGKVLSIGGAGELVVYPAHDEIGRQTAAESEFTMRIDPKNVGVMLRRKLDYSFPNQRAGVYVADASAGRVIQESDWQHAGIWYLAGSNTCVYSDPRGELGQTLHNVQTSNRRFRDDEFLVSRELTKGRSAIRVRVRFTPVNRPLFPGHPLPELVWSEIRYDAYSYVLPSFQP